MFWYLLVEKKLISSSEIKSCKAVLNKTYYLQCQEFQLVFSDAVKIFFASRDGSAASKKLARMLMLLHKHTV